MTNVIAVGFGVAVAAFLVSSSPPPSHSSHLTDSPPPQGPRRPRRAAQIPRRRRRTGSAGQSILQGRLRAEDEQARGDVDPAAKVREEESSLNRGFLTTMLLRLWRNDGMTDCGGLCYTVSDNCPRI